jgi:hypothetical protein
MVLLFQWLDIRGTPVKPNVNIDEGRDIIDHDKNVEQIMLD